MQHVSIVLNATEARRVKRNGREWLVAPMTTIVPGVLNGSKGPLLYPVDQIKRSVGMWDKVPITVYHPIAANGQHVSASAPGVLQRQGVGHLERTHWAGKLKHEGWFDVAKLKQVDPRVLNALETGQQMELSTGLYTNNVPEEGVHNGRGYRFVAKDYAPDHLAILPDQVGACSLNDGCGLNVNSAPWNPDQHPRGPDGKFGIGDRTGLKEVKLSEVLKSALKKAGDVKKAFTAKLDKMTDVPGLRTIKAGMKKAGEINKKLTDKLNARYGKVATYAIKASGQALGMTAMTQGVILPGSGLWGMIPGLAVAEGVLQASKLARSAKRLLFNAEQLTRDDIHKLSKKYLKDFMREWQEYTKTVTNSRRCDGCGRLVENCNCTTNRLMEFLGNVKTVPTQARELKTGQFLPTKGSSQKQVHGAAKQGSSQEQFQSSSSGNNQPQQTDDPDDDDPISSEALRRGLSVEELKKQLGINMRVTRQQVANAVAVLNAFNAEQKCPECGGKMVDGECEECGYEEDDDTRNDMGPDPAVPIQPVSRGDSNPDGRQNRKLTPTRPAFRSSDDPDDEDDDHSDDARRQQAAATQQAPPSQIRNSFEIIANWCNQHGGTTCKSGNSGTAEGLSKVAKVASKKAFKTGLAEHHEAARVAHKNAAIAHVKGGNKGLVVAHTDAMQYHESKTHTAPTTPIKNRRGNKVFTDEYGITWNRQQTNNDKWADMFGNMKEKGDFDPKLSAGSGTGGGRISAEAHAASSHAEKSGSEKKHREAADAHNDAAEHHRSESNDELAAHHSNMARSHTQKANIAAKKEAGTRNQLQQIITNCTCKATKRELRRVLNEADGIGDGSFAGAIMTGRSGDPGDDDDDDDIDDDGYAKKGEKGPKKNTLSTNQWLAQQPQAVREQFMEGQRALQAKKAGIVRRLTANIQDTDRQVARQRQLMTNSLTELQGLLELVSNQEPAPEPYDPLPIFGPGGLIEMVGNAGGSDDVLDIPVLNFGKQTA